MTFTNTIVRTNGIRMAVRDELKVRYR